MTNLQILQNLIAKGNNKLSELEIVILQIKKELKEIEHSPKPIPANILTQLNKLKLEILERVVQKSNTDWDNVTAILRTYQNEEIGI